MRELYGAATSLGLDVLVEVHNDAELSAAMEADVAIIDIQVASRLLVAKRFGELGLEVPTREQMTPEALRVHQKAEADKWWPVIKQAGIKAD